MNDPQARSDLRVNLSGKQAVVTGANRGIGYAIARSFVDAGAEVTIAALEEDVDDTAQNLSKEFGRQVVPMRCDIRSIDDIQKLAASVETVDILVNNAGFEYATPIHGPFPAVSTTFRKIVETNVIGTFEVTRALLPKTNDGGRVINTASIWGKTAVAEYSGYCASKHAIIGLTRSLSRELGYRRITVNAVCPGWVRTEASMRSLSQMAAASGKSEEDLLRDISSAQSVGGLMEPNDVADMYLFLASDAASNITGQAFTVDRGELMR